MTMFGFSTCDNAEHPCVEVYADEMYNVIAIFPIRDGDVQLAERLATLLIDAFNKAEMQG